jgi:uncharacterized protein VirK/YbjX
MNSSDPLKKNGRERSIWAAIHTSFTTGFCMVAYIWNKGNASFRLVTFLRALSIIRYARGHLKLLRVISLPHARGLAYRHHRLPYRYLNPYLARGFCKSTRLEALTNHYEYLQGRVSDSFLMRVYEKGETLWEECIEGRSYSIELTFPEEHDWEGDLRLNFKNGPVLLYTLTFSIAPGRYVQAADEQVLLVSAIQGGSHVIHLIKEATKNCNDSSPALLLLAAAQGIALSLDIPAIAGVGTGQQVSREGQTGFVFDYDRFWESVTGDELRKDFYVVPVPFPQKPLELVRANRRSRAIRRRELRGRVTEQVRAYFRQGHSSRPKENLPVDGERRKVDVSGNATAMLAALLIEIGKRIELASVLALHA